MLVLARKPGEKVIIGNGITVTVLAAQNGRVKLGFTGPAEIPIHREEVQQKITEHTEHAAVRPYVYAAR